MIRLDNIKGIVVAEIHFHPALQRFTHQPLLEISVDTIGEIIPWLCSEYPQLQTYLVDQEGQLSPYINCYINGKNINTYSTNDYLPPDATIELLTALVGG